MKVIVEEAKVTRLENSLKKKQIHDGKMNDPINVRAEKSRKKTRPAEGLELVIVDT